MMLIGWNFFYLMKIKGSWSRRYGLAKIRACLSQSNGIFLIFKFNTMERIKLGEYARCPTSKSDPVEFSKETSKAKKKMYATFEKKLYYTL